MENCPVVEPALLERLRSVCPTLVLASQSPNRRAVLEQAGINVVVRPQDIWEICGFTEPHKVVTSICSAKMESYLKSPLFDPSLPAVAVDTLVSLDGALLGKPADEVEARRMLLSLSGRWHEVYSGMAVYNPKKSSNSVICDVTRVLFDVLDEASLSWYMETQDWVAAAGAYKIQRNGFKLISKIEGSYSNIIGLPVERLIEELR